ncbi:MAG: signal peptidase I [Coriobacteriales bacterium]|jgi:signal peptidase I|nr:signal peptidase I [Coriobacteriales bacterium]
MARHFTDDQADGRAEESKATHKKPPQFFRAIAEFAVALAIAVGLVWVTKTFVMEPYEVPTGSMETTIKVGDKLLAEKISLNFSPVKSGDIVVFADKVMPGRVLVKRVIATGGQTVDLRDGLVYVDGNPLYEPYTHGMMSRPLEQHFDNMRITYPYKVPEGSLWVMGDNRENSADSRYFGHITENSVYGKALMVFWPLEDISPL